MPDQVVQVAVAAAARLGHSPTWDNATESVLWTDLTASIVHRYLPGRQDHTLPVSQPVSAAKPRSRGGVVLTLSEGIALFDLHGEQRTWLVYWARDGVRGGATTIDSRGRLWATTVREDESGEGWLTRISPDGTPKVELIGLRAGNGLAFDAEHRALFLADSVDREIRRYELVDGRIDAGRTWCDIDDGAPSGICVDVEGGVWAAVRDRGQLRRYAPDGSLERIIELPVQRPTGCCFGGFDLTDLYVTSATDGLDAPSEVDGALLVLPDAGKGAPAPAFSG